MFQKPYIKDFYSHHKIKKKSTKISGVKFFRLFHFPHHLGSWDAKRTIQGDLHFPGKYKLTRKPLDSIIQL